MNKLHLIKTIAWTLAIYILCAIPGNSVPSTPLSLIPHFDKVVHFGIFFILAIFLIATLKQYSKLNRKYINIICLMIIILYGAVIELLQAFFFINRSGDILDLIADTIGGTCAIFCFDYLKTKKDLLLNSKSLRNIKFLKKIL